MIDIISQASVATLLLLLFAAAIRPVVKHWAMEHIRAGVDEAVSRRLAALQLDLDKDLERHRTDLSIAAERIRSSLSRAASDFSIYAQRRHDAVSNLFAEFLRCEALTNDQKDIRSEDEPPDGRETLVSRVIRARNEANEAYYRNVLYLPEELDTAVTEARDAFHDLLVEYLSPSETPNQSKGRARDALRGAMLRLQALARAELATARPSTSLSLLPNVR